MKHKYNFIVSTIMLLALFSSCLKEENNQIKPKDNTQKDNKFSQNILSNTANIYTDFLIQTDRTAGFSSMQEHSLAEHRIYTKFSDGAEQLKSGTNNFMVLANNVELYSKQKSTETDQCLLADNWYGKKVSFKIKRNRTLKNGGNHEDTVNMYIPEQISITSPPVETLEESFPMCYSKNFILRWNKDLKNENGLVVSVEWVGAMYAGERRNGTTVRNIDFIEEDDGEFVLDEKIFDGIPDVAIAYITILRGNINIVTQDDGTTKVYGESHAVLPFILIKDLDKYYSMKP